MKIDEELCHSVWCFSLNQNDLQTFFCFKALRKVLRTGEYLYNKKVFSEKLDPKNTAENGKPIKIYLTTQENTVATTSISKKYKFFKFQTKNILR